MWKWKAIIPREIDIRELNTIKLLEITDMLNEVRFEELMNDTQKRIVEILKEREFVSEKELLKELGVSKKTLISNIKKLEDAGIVFSNRSSTKILTLNPAIFYFNDLLRVTRENILAIAQISEKMKKEGIKIGKRGV